MASLDILCFNPFNLKNKIMKIERKKIFCGPSKILKNISWLINICLKCFMTTTKTLRLPPPPSPYILNVRSLITFLPASVLVNLLSPFLYLLFSQMIHFVRSFFFSFEISGKGSDKPPTFIITFNGVTTF